MMIDGKIIKVCGMQDGNNIRETEALGIDMIGFIFYPKSPRCICEMPGYMPVHAQRVGVFVNESKETIGMYADRFGLDYIQLHGHESPEFCRSLQSEGYRLIKAFSVACTRDLKPVRDYEEFCEYFLFDTKCDQYGGSGNQFDWSILDAYNEQIPFLLSGGINPYSTKALREFSHPRLAGYDLNSRFETKPGMKDTERIRQFLNELH